MYLSRNAKESIKIALALVIVYAIAMGINWEKPFWGAFAVIVCSQANLGQSLNRAILWMLGTLFALLGGWIIVASFPQDRWLFMIALSVWVAGCVYILQRSKRQYFWMTCGYVILMLWDATGGDLSLSYEEGIFRIQESLLGIIVYGLVAVLIWPNCSREELHEAAVSLLDMHRAFANRCFLRIQDRKKVKVLRDKRVELLRADTRLRTAINDASSDSYEIWECRRQWKAFGHRTTAVTQSLLKLEESLALSSDLGIMKFLLNMNDYLEVMRGRFKRVRFAIAEDEVAGDARERVVRGDVEKVKKELSTPETAAIAVTRRSLNDLEVETRALINAVNDLKSLEFSSSSTSSEREEYWFGLLMPDPDRLANVVRVLVGIWISYLAYLFVPDMIGGLLVVLLITIIAIIASVSPQINLFKSCIYTILVCLMSAPLYFLVMPKLQGFYSLGLMVFFWTFTISYFANRMFGAQSMIRTLALLFPQIIFNFNNYQTYSFVVYTNYIFVLAIIFCILAVSRNIPISSHPERNFKKNVNRLLDSAARLVVEGDLPALTRRSIFHRLYVLYHLNIVVISHEKILYWKEGIDVNNVKGMSRDQMRRVIDLLMLIANQVKILHGIDHSKMKLVATNSMLREVFIWRSLVGKILFYLSGEQRNINIKSLRRGYRRIFDRVNVDVGGLMELWENDEETAKGVSNFLYFLGVTHCISNYLDEFYKLSESVDWKYFCEERCL
ncbi:FUSC family protein [Microbulbifer sp. ANSA002]|uniref:FUSC family protein n=1 Tax=unclassified Microbulbifer TaxID=2619833 RepID=UPI0040420C53